MSQRSQRRVWSLFLLVVGVVLMALNALELSLIALTLGAVIALAGLLGLLLRET